MRTVLRLVLLFVLLGSVTAWSCWKKERDHWSPTEALLRPPDMTAPLITNPQPPTSVDVFHDERGLMFTAEDPSVDGFPGSGVDAAGVNATMNGLSFPVSSNGSMFSVDISSLGGALPGGQGQTSIDVTVPDNAGNVASTTFDFFYDPFPPGIQVDEFTPSGPVETADASVTFSLSGSFDDPNFARGEFKVVKEGPDGECGTEDDTLWPQGTEGGQVSQNFFQLQASYDLSFEAFNGNTGDSPVTATYCGRLRAFDSAQDKTGADNPNFAEEIFSTSLTWQPMQPTTGGIRGQVTLDGESLPEEVTVEVSNGTTTTTDTEGGRFEFQGLFPGTYTVRVVEPPDGSSCPEKSVDVVAGQTAQTDIDCTTAPVDFTVNVDGSYRHNNGTSEVCGEISTSPAQPDAPFEAEVTGPGVTGDGMVNGSLDGGGTGVFSVDINVIGNYTITVEVTSNGTTRTDQTTVEVTGSQGTCPAAISSIRFKTDVRSLLPGGITLLQLRPVVFRYRAGYGDPTEFRLGLLAEEVHRAYPGAVLLDESGRPEGIHYGLLRRLVAREALRRLESAMLPGVARRP